MKGCWKKTLPGAVLALVASLWIATSNSIRADEGMWTLDNPPTKYLKERYGFEPDSAWLKNVQLSAVRFNDGGSGSFVSAEGLVLTNHHVARGQLQKVSSPKKDYCKDGFHARTTAEELRCPDLELNVLVSMENVTDKVFASVKPGMAEKDALKARKAAMAKIEKESLDSTGMRSDVVTLYHGGEYWLYRYKKYTDIRLVFAPEEQIAFFGGDPDNFTFPRHDLDMAIFRVYEKDKAIKSPAFLKWNPKGAADGELVFVLGHPGRTDRLQIHSQLEMQRDHELPLKLKILKRTLATSYSYAKRGSEEAREAGDRLRGLENTIKAWEGELQGLMTPQLMAKKAQEEKEFIKLVSDKPEWREAYGDAWPRLSNLQKQKLQRLRQILFRKPGGLRLPAIALQIVRYVAEVKKPDGERLEEYHDSQLESLRFKLYSPAPIYRAFEEVLLADSLKYAVEELGPGDPFVKEALGGKSPEQVAKELISETKLTDPKVRKNLVDGAEEAVKVSTDPLIVWIRKIDPVLREIRKWQEDNIESVEVACGEKIGKARFAAFGKSAYPDATFTLRIAYGAVKGYPMNGTRAPSKTTYHGLFDRACSFDFKQPFDLPQRYIDRKDKLDLSVGLNFVCTCDIIGGNSGSPVINKAGEIVGLIFDGNIESLPGRYVFEEEANRAVAVHTAGMSEALRKLYDAEAIMNELLGK